MSKFQLIKVSQCYESEFDVRGKGYDDPKINDLVASVKEKGVIVPVIVRERPKGNKKFEVMVGKRRLKASVIAKKEMIKAEIRKLTDDEARELQIIENLQRLDVHPLDEGFSYRGLIEKSKYTISSIVIKVGKSKNYIRQRLFLTNLSERAANFYRKGKMTDSHAVLVAKLSSNDQNRALRYLSDGFSTVRELKAWIEQEFYKPLSFQPWGAGEEAVKMVGECIECAPNKNTLFGDVKEGVCTDLKCWNRKMKKFISFQVANYKQEGSQLLRVSKEYGSAPDGILSRSDYSKVSRKKNEQCKYVQKAIVSDGPGMGAIIRVCVDPKCPDHKGYRSDYKPSAKEKEERRKEAKKQKAKREKEEETLVEALDRVKWPLSQKVLDIIIEMILQGQGTTVLRPVAKRFGIVAKKVTKYGYTSLDWEIPVREALKKMNKSEKLRFVVGIMLERIWDDSKKKIIKELKND